MNFPKFTKRQYAYAIIIIAVLSAIVFYLLKKTKEKKKPTKKVIDLAPTEPKVIAQFPLKKGMTGDNVLALQMWLNKVKDQNVELTGEFDEQTVIAVDLATKRNNISREFWKKTKMADYLPS